MYVVDKSVYAIKTDEEYNLPEELTESDTKLIGTVDDGGTINGLAINGNIVSVVCDDVIYYIQAAW